MPHVQDPLSGVISGTVRVEIAADAADEYSSLSPLEGMKQCAAKPLLVDD